MSLRKVNFPLSTLSLFLHPGSFFPLEIEEKTNRLNASIFDLEESMFGLKKLIIPQVKCCLLCFVLVLGEKAFVPREYVFSYEKYCPPGIFLLVHIFLIVRLG